MRKGDYFRKYASQYLKNVASRGRLRFLIFFVTSRCNLRCGPCFNWQNLNRPDDLTIDEIRKISPTIGEFHTLLLSGGEPFLRDDLPDVCGEFIRNNKISILSIPTNCTLPERIVKFTEEILGKYPRLRLSVNPSLDGLKETHDRSRCVEGVFDNVMKSIDLLSGLKKKYDGLEVIVNTVINNRNIGELESLMDMVFRTPGVDSHDFELMRGDPNDKRLELPSIGEIEKAHRLIARNHARYLARRKAAWAEKLAVIGLVSFVQAMKERAILKNGWFFKCTAGRNVGVIDADGGVRLCELLPPVGNLRQKGYDFSAVWNSAEARALRSGLLKERCDCTHVCFIKMSGSAYLRSVAYLFYYYMRYLTGHDKY